jgi:hypothetical protein
MATELIPIPGAAGISEAFYVVVFGPSYNILDPNKTLPSIIQASQILWRVITFHVPLVISGLVTALYKGKPSKEEVSAASRGSQTYLTLTINTYDERRKTYQTIYSTKQINKKDFEKWKKSRKNGDDAK